MNIIYAKHPCCDHAYCFEVPDNMVPHIKRGNVLFVNTMQGNTIAEAITDVISGPGAEHVAFMNGAYEPIKPVLAFANEQIIKYIENKVRASIVEDINSNRSDIDDYIPFPLL